MTPAVSIRGRLELMVYTWRGEVKQYPLPASGRVRIGRDPRTNDICIQDPSVSGNHAILTVDSSLRLQDVGSTNGTILRKGDKDVEVTRTDRNDEKRLTGETVTVEPGHRIILGSVMTIVRMTRLPANANGGDNGTWPYSPIVRHAATLAVFEEARLIARSSSRACVLLLGETGVGKDVLARAIHIASPRAKGAFIAVNCGGITESMFAREMFGHRKHAFTDAKTDALGYFEAANDGTLFLDEVADLPLSCQTALLRVLDDRRIIRVGDTQSRPVNARVLAATNKRLEDCVEQGTFRKDLYNRLHGFDLELPPLRERSGDIIPMAEAFVEEECRLIEQPFVPRLSRDVVAMLQAYRFPGNVRELRTAMMRAVTYCQGEQILPEHLPEEMREYDKTDPMWTPPFVVSEALDPDVSEADRIRQALSDSGGNVTRAAVLLGMSRRTLFYKLNKMQDMPRARKTNAAMSGMG